MVCSLHISLKQRIHCDRVFLSLILGHTAHRPLNFFIDSDDDIEMVEGVNDP